MRMEPSICVIVAAKDAASTIARAVRSALNQNETAEVIVVDDASSDDTFKVAKMCDDGSGRLRVVRFELNRGPSAARNFAISISTSPIISILDADDFFLPGRFSNLLQHAEWDVIADNIAFVSHVRLQNRLAELIPKFPNEPRTMDLVEFVKGNISRRGAKRAEIGFLKPLIRRSLLVQHSLRYDETLRLGEDYDLYTRLLLHGALYKVTRSCGYVAVLRTGSLSGQHGTSDLEKLHHATKQIVQKCNVPSKEAYAILKQHSEHIRFRYELRRFLDVKTSGGHRGAIFHLIRHPKAVPAVVCGIISDKIEKLSVKKTRTPATAENIRFLI
ncbi:glycosyltransferase family 2 protein [Agrobacterium cavarae]|uniref:glycosyltransferase family 2 protein n=2 Tax=Agrobacterium cavarae TaxID=2528239 RepID=UPI003FD3A473